MMKTFLDNVRNEAPRHGSIPFWSWNDKLEEPILRRQIAHMKELGYRGFFMHARGGLQTEYMSKDWFDCIRICIDEAKKQGMEAWAYDENGWPSGFGGGELLKDPKNFAAYLTAETTTTYPTLHNNILGVYVGDEAGYRRVTAPLDGATYLVITRGYDFSYIDTMNPAVAAQFIAVTHERYRKEIGDDLGGAMPGFFTDEPQYFCYGTQWSDTFLTTFEPRFGYSVLDALPSLFCDYEGAIEHRYDYHIHCSERFLDGFIKPVYTWCDEHGIRLTGHAIEEWMLNKQAKYCGGIMPFYRYQHIPGIDYLGREVKNALGARQIGSVCEQLGRKEVMTETFACTGWDVLPRELKRVGELQFTYGVNLLCEHLYPYSERGERKRDYPCHFSEHNVWHKEEAAFERYFARLGAALSQGKEIADTLVIHPVHTDLLYYQDLTNDHTVIESELAKRFDRFVDRMSFDQIPYHFGDETILRDLGRVEGRRIRVGQCLYDKVVLTCCETLDASTVALLRDYLAAGGKLYLDDCAPNRIDGRLADLSFLRSNMTYDELREAVGIRLGEEGASIPLHMTVRRTDFGRLIFLANTTEKSYTDLPFTVKNCDGLVGLDLETMTEYSLRGEKTANGTVTVLLNFDDSASVLLLEKEADLLPMAKTPVTAPLLLPERLPFASRPENALTLDRACVSLNGAPFTEERPIERIRDELLRDRFAGNLTLRFTFRAEALPKALLLVTENHQGLSLRVNGTEVPLGNDARIDARFHGTNIASHARLGENTVDLTFPYTQRQEVYDVLFGGGNEALRNCLSFDTELEAIYLFGDFRVLSQTPFVPVEKNAYRVGGPFVLVEPTDTVDRTDLVKDGYPFFAGSMVWETTLHHRHGDPTRLALDGRYAVAELSLNGTPVPLSIFAKSVELAPYLREGENTLRLRLVISNRNLLGPHHSLDPEPYTVYPGDFSFEKQWRDGTCPTFCDGYALIREGIY